MAVNNAMLIGLILLIQIRCSQINSETSNNRDECSSPCIKTNPEAKNIIKKPYGSMIVLHCQIGGIRKKTQLVIWEKNGETIFMNKVSFLSASSSAGKRIVLQQSESGKTKVQSTLTIYNIQSIDDGVYSCKVSDSSQQMDFLITTYEPDPDIYYSGRRQVTITAPGYLTRGAPFNLTCYIDTSLENASSVTVDWYKHGVFLTTSPSDRMVLIKRIISLSTSSFPSVSTSSSSSSSSSSLSSPPPPFSSFYKYNQFNQYQKRKEHHQQKKQQQSYSKSNQRRTIDKIRSIAILLFKFPDQSHNGVYECRAYKPLSQNHFSHIDTAAVRIKVIPKVSKNTRLDQGNNDKINSRNSIYVKSKKFAVSSQKHLLQNDGVVKNKNILVTSNIENGQPRNLSGYSSFFVFIISLTLVCLHIMCHQVE